MTRDLESVPATWEAQYQAHAQNLIVGRLRVASLLLTTTLLAEQGVRLISGTVEPAGFVWGRGAIALLGLLLFGLTYVRVPSRIAFALSIVTALIVAGSAEVMIVVGGDYDTPGQIVLAVLVIGWGLIFPYSPVQIGIVGGFTVAVYVAPVIFGVQDAGGSEFPFNLFTIIGSSVVALTASTMTSRLRRREFFARRRVQREKKRADDLLDVVIPIGVALSAEQEFDQLLERIVVEATGFCNADGGTLYLRTEDERLEFVVVRNASLGIAMGGPGGQEITLPPLRLYDEATGEPNHHNVATYAALCGDPVNVADAYRAETFDFSGTRDFDARTGYRSTSFLTIPLKDSRDRVIGVLQLINAQDPETGQVIPFDANLQ
jgi:hypothetical protein